MRTVIVELTNRCNLACQHCFDGRHGGREDLPLELLAKVLADARALGFTFLGFTGGDPTVHPRFAEVLRATCEAGYDFGFNTNGWSFTSIYPVLLPVRERLQVITFSLDGATEPTHDRLRGHGSYRRVMRALDTCASLDLPFTLNMVVTAHNRHELPAMVELAAHVGSRGLRFGHLMPSPLTTNGGFDLSPAERRLVEAEIWELQRHAPIPLTMAPGYYVRELFPCAPLNLQEVNVDVRGNLTTCCHLSGQGNGALDGDVVGSLTTLTFVEAYHRLVAENARFRQAKLRHFGDERAVDSDWFPCWYCALSYRKVDWLRDAGEHPWAALLRERAGVSSSSRSRRTVLPVIGSLRGAERQRGL